MFKPRNQSDEPETQRIIFAFYIKVFHGSTDVLFLRISSTLGIYLNNLHMFLLSTPLKSILRCALGNGAHMLVFASFFMTKAEFLNMYTLKEEKNASWQCTGRDLVKKLKTSVLDITRHIAWKVAMYGGRKQTQRYFVRYDFQLWVLLPSSWPLPPDSRSPDIGVSLGTKCHCQINLRGRPTFQASSAFQISIGGFRLCKFRCKQVFFFWFSIGKCKGYKTAVSL